MTPEQRQEHWKRVKAKRQAKQKETRKANAAKQAQDANKDTDPAPVPSDTPCESTAEPQGSTLRTMMTANAAS